MSSKQKCLKLIGKKAGMTQFFGPAGDLRVGTVIHVDPNVVVQIKSLEKDGYNALQLGAFDVKAKSLTKQVVGHFAKKSIDLKKKLSESCLEKTDEYKVGQKIDVSVFQVGDFVDVIGVSKGKGFQGVMKKYGFKGGPGAHGSGFHRHAGSTGMRSTPGRCLPLGPRASRMGGERKTIQNLKVLHVNAEQNFIVVEGSIAGAKSSVVLVSKAKKKTLKSKK